MKIGIVGSGMVGSTAAYALIMEGIGRRIILVDKDEKRSRAEANDLWHAVPFSRPLTVDHGDYAALKGSRMVIISAGVSQKPGESRLDLLKRNAAVFREVVPNVVENAPHGVIVVATNPLDIMTHLAALYAAEHGVEKNRVLGSGTMLDTARFRSLLAETIGIDPQHIHAHVIGEHGDSEILAWSLVTVGSLHLDDYCTQMGIRLDERMKQNIDDQVRHAAYTIIDGKGATYYGIGTALAKLADVILHDQRSILTVSTTADEVLGVKDVTLSLPRIVGGDGVLSTLRLPLDRKEAAGLAKSARLVREAIEEII